MSVRLKKFFIYTITGTIMTFLYAHQNIETTRLGYDVSRNELALERFIDQHRQLVYNLNRLESPTGLSERLSAEKIELVEAGIDSVFYASGAWDRTLASTEQPHMTIVERMLDALIQKAEARGSR
ncbi:MAG: hypothetical protein ABH885_06400 [Candidatus Omnitrophota bacterium]